eukprot:scaffold130996_cov31-Prasinocladus_malaysianus.AAC.1
MIGADHPDDRGLALPEHALHAYDLGAYQSLIVNTEAMRADASQLNRQAAIVPHSHNNFCNITAAIRESATTERPFLVYFLGKYAEQHAKFLARIEKSLIAKIPVKVKAMQIYGKTLDSDFEKLAQADVGVVWDQCDDSRFTPFHGGLIDVPIAPGMEYIPAAIPMPKVTRPDG